MALFPQLPIWTKTEEHFYEKIARSGLSIAFAIEQAQMNGYPKRSDEEVERHFIYRRLPWKLIANTSYMPYKDEEVEVMDDAPSLEQGVDLTGGVTRESRENFDGNMGSSINMGNDPSMGEEPNFGNKRRKK